MSSDAFGRVPSGFPDSDASDEDRGPESLSLVGWSTSDAGGEETRRTVDFEISAVREGDGILRLDDEVHGFSKGDLLLVAPGRRLSVISRDMRGVRLLTLRCPVSLAAKALDEGASTQTGGEPSPIELLRRIGPVIRAQARAAALGAALLHQLDALQEGRGRSRALRIRSRLLDLLGLLLDHATQEESGIPQDVFPRAGRRELIGGMIEAMRRADVSDLTVEDAANGLNLSVRHFRRLFREHTGQSFHEFLTDLRVEHAKQILLRSERKIIEVAWETGYGSLSQFNLVFKKKTGWTPGQYRARHRVRE